MTTITVTAEHIARGVREDCEHCPVALAVMDALPHAGVPAVNCRQVTFRVADDKLINIDLPLEAAEFIWDFDANETVRPFTFELDYPEARPAA